MLERKDASDLGKISLWLDERTDTKTLATGKIQLFLEDGSVREVSVYLYENDKKQSDKSPDYYGFIKEAPTKKGFLTKKSSTTTIQRVEQGDFTNNTQWDDDVAF